MAQEMQRRFRDGELDLGEYQGMHEVQFDDREEWRM